MSPRHNSPSQEFLDGCLRLKGMARSIDVHFIMVLIHRLQKQLSGFETGHNAVLARLTRQRSREMSHLRARDKGSWALMMTARGLSFWLVLVQSAWDCFCHLVEA
eukprot:s30_g12.t1